MKPKVSIITPVWNQRELVIRAMDSIPRRKDIEVLVRDDGSTDGTLEALVDYSVANPDLNMTVFSNGENEGVAYTKNRLLESATGEYFHVLDSDDYLYTQEYSRAIDMIDGSDVVYMDFRRNDGFPTYLTAENVGIFCAQILRFIRMDFAKGITFPENIRAADDWYFHNDLMAKHPTEQYTHLIAYHYNFPRAGSLSDLKMKGLL